MPPYVAFLLAIWLGWVPLTAVLRAGGQRELARKATQGGLWWAGLMTLHFPLYWWFLVVGDTVEPQAQREAQEYITGMLTWGSALGLLVGVFAAVRWRQMMARRYLILGVAAASLAGVAIYPLVHGIVMVTLGMVHVFPYLVGLKSWHEP